MLGVQLDLRQSGDTLCFVTNTEERVEELAKELGKAIRSKARSRSDGEKLRGRLQFASSQVFGRMFRRLLEAVLSNHVTHGRKTLSDRIQTCVSDIRRSMIQNTPRKIEVSQAEVLRIYVDAFDYCKYSGLGGLIVNISGETLSFFSTQVDTSLLDDFMVKGQKTVIQELEMMAVLAAIKVWKKLIKSRRVVLFTYSEAVEVLSSKVGQQTKTVAQ